jgi:phosphocarrier protein
MEVTKLKVNNRCGLHLRTAAKIVEFSKRCKSKITFCYDCKFADSCSILQLLSLGASRDAKMTVIAQGQDEKEVVERIGELFSDGAGI